MKINRYYRRTINLFIILGLFWLLIFGFRMQLDSVEEKANYYKDKLDKLTKKKNKDLMMLDSILNPTRPILRYYENGWCLTFEPCGYKSKTNKIK